MKIFLPILLCLAAGPAFAQSYTPAVLDSCLATAGPEAAEAQRCITLSSTACQETEGGSSTLGVAYCLGEELQHWDRLLNTAWKEALRYAEDSDKALKQSDATAPASAGTLRAAQRAWISYRDLSCQFEGERYHGGTIAGLAASHCSLVLTATQTLRLRMLSTL